MITMLAGLIGVPLGSMLAQRLRRVIENCDPHICAAGLLISAPMVYMALVLPKTDSTLCFMFIFFAQVALNLCWSIVADILLVRYCLFFFFFVTKRDTTLCHTYYHHCCSFIKKINAIYLVLVRTLILKYIYLLTGLNLKTKINFVCSKDIKKLLSSILFLHNFLKLIN